MRPPLPPPPSPSPLSRQELHGLCVERHHPHSPPPSHGRLHTVGERRSESPWEDKAFYVKKAIWGGGGGLPSATNSEPLTLPRADVDSRLS